MRRSLRKRLIISWFVLIVVLLSLTLFHDSLRTHKYSFTMHDFLLEPQKYAGQTRNIMGVYQEPTKKGFSIIYNKEKVEIIYDKEHQAPKYGEILIFGELQRDGTVKALGVHNYNYNFLLYLLSFIAGIIIIVVFFREWKLTKKGFVDKRKLTRKIQTTQNTTKKRVKHA